jgi:hypothetical protein
VINVIFALAILGTCTVMALPLVNRLRNARKTVDRRQPRALRGEPVSSVDGPGPVVSQPDAWTALDDQQLTRLLRDSTP